MGAVVVIGFLMVLGPMVNRPVETMTARRWVIFGAGIVLFFAGWLVLFNWLPDSTFHCTQHCFPWGD
jgi:hypothetical protein